MLSAVQHVPRLPLARHIEHLWLVRGNLATRWRNAIFPDGAMEFIINLGDPQKLCDPVNPQAGNYFKSSWISGERSAPIVIEETGLIHLVGVRFKPGGAYPFFRFPLSEFTDRVVATDAVWGGAVELLREQLAGAPEPRLVFARLERWLEERLRAGTAPTPGVSYALTQIQARSGEARIGRIVETIGMSHKQLTREFDRCVGLSPKQFARICTFQSAIRRIGFAPAVDWADTAAACGYYDQAHFIREFSAFSGLTPAAYLDRRGPFLNYISVG